MSYLVLARKWRPRSFDELVGQDHVRRALTNALDSGASTTRSCSPAHAAWARPPSRASSPSRSTARRRVFQALRRVRGVPRHRCRALRGPARGRRRLPHQGGRHRELLDNVQYAPARGRCKVYLIDEVHMLSTHSFNALLKTLEEPPPHVKFLLATTDRRNCR